MLLCNLCHQFASLEAQSCPLLPGSIPSFLSVSKSDQSRTHTRFISLQPCQLLFTSALQDLPSANHLDPSMNFGRHPKKAARVIFSPESLLGSHESHPFCFPIPVHSHPPGAQETIVECKGHRWPLGASHPKTRLRDPCTRSQALHWSQETLHY